MLGTSSERVPSGLVRSMARPRLTCAGSTTDRLAVDLGEAAVHLRHRGERLDRGAADEVGEGDLAAAAAGQVVVDDDAVVDQQLGRDGAHAGRGRDGEAGLHVGDDAGGRAAQRGRVRVADVRRGRCLGRRCGAAWPALPAGAACTGAGCGSPRLRGFGPRLGRRGAGGAAPGGRPAPGGLGAGRSGRDGGAGGVPAPLDSADAPFGGRVGREVALPRGVDRVLVLEVLVVHLVDQPLVRAEVTVRVGQGFTRV